MGVSVPVNKSNNTDYILFDAYTQKLTVPTRMNILGVFNDHNMRKVKFKIPKIIFDTDISLFEFNINFTNANGDDDSYEVPKEFIDNTSDSEYVILYWRISNNVTAKAGDVIYSLCIKKYDENGIVLNEINSEKTKGTVLEGLETIQKILERYPDLFLALKVRMDELEQNGVSEDKIKEVLYAYLDENPINIEETDPTVYDWAKEPEKPKYTASEVGADEYGTAVSVVSEHNTALDSHNDIRIALQELAKRFNTLADSDDETLDQFSEVVAYIKSNKNLIDAITTSKINTSDIIDNLVTNVSNKPLSASQGVVLKSLIDAIVVPTKTSDLQNDSGFLTEHQDLSGYALKSEVPKSASDVGADVSGTAESKVSAHNVSDAAHNDIRLLVKGLTDRLNAIADSDDTTLDQMSEIVAYIKSNKSLIDAITTSKVNVSDIIDNLTTNVSNKPLSASQGVALKNLIDAIIIPTVLPNPKALTFTGAVTGSYDGSEEVSVNIPSGGGGGSTSNELQLEHVLSIVSDGTSILYSQDYEFTDGVYSMHMMISNNDIIDSENAGQYLYFSIGTNIYVLDYRSVPGVTRKDGIIVHVSSLIAIKNNKIIELAVAGSNTTVDGNRMNSYDNGVEITNKKVIFYSQNSQNVPSGAKFDMYKFI